MNPYPCKAQPAERVLVRARRRLADILSIRETDMILDREGGGIELHLVWVTEPRVVKGQTVENGQQLMAKIRWGLTTALYSTPEGLKAKHHEECREIRARLVAAGWPHA